MTLTFTTAVGVLLCCTYSWRTGDCRTTLPCFVYNNCAPDRHTSWPQPNEYAIYRTYNRNSYPYCKLRNAYYNKNYQTFHSIDDLGSGNVRLLYSPGYLLGRRYANNMLVKYNVQCPEGKLPFLVYNKFLLRGECVDNRCEDYVTISCATCGTSETCGRDPTDNYYNLEQEHFTVTFRTNRAWNQRGFELSVTCFDLTDLNTPGSSPSSGKKKRNLETSVVRVKVDLRDVVTYRNNTITVSRGRLVVRSISNIARLVIRDASGGDHSFRREAVEFRPGGANVYEPIRLRGPGELQLLSSTATFLRDSQPFALSVNEKEVVKNLTDELFHVIPPSNDHYITDITDSADFHEDDELSYLHRRSAAVTPRLISTSVIRLALLYSNSDNPVVKAAAIPVLWLLPLSRVPPGWRVSAKVYCGHRVRLHSWLMSAAVNSSTPIASS